MRVTLVAFVIIVFAATASAATPSKRAHPVVCRSGAVTVTASGKRLCNTSPGRAAVFGTGSRAGSLPDRIEYRAVTISVSASAASPDRAVCSVTCSDGAVGTFSAHFDPGIWAPYLAPVPSELNFGGSVFCLIVFENNAIVGGLIEHSNVGAAIGHPYYILISDHGYPGTGRDMLFSEIMPVDDVFASCSNIFGPFSDFDGSRGIRLDDGNFVVAH